MGFNGGLRMFELCSEDIEDSPCDDAVKLATINFEDIVAEGEERPAETDCVGCQGREAFVWNGWHLKPNTPSMGNRINIMES